MTFGSQWLLHKVHFCIRSRLSLYVSAPIAECMLMCAENVCAELDVVIDS